jgi:hypothetical protein
LLLFLASFSASASNPRWVTGPPYFSGAGGNNVTWYTTQLLYYTDPGDLSGSVNHAAADALVNAAASVWNAPTSAMVIARGGALDEHVSAANAYVSSSGPVFPEDAQSGNYAAKQIAVIYDSDGSVTDMLLGNGASAPAECRQNGVTESVDSITPAGFIQHAVVAINGRCSGPAPQQQSQLQYQLERVFGRVLGIGWSQTNDNVFTQTPQPTYNQALHWPIMHPIDIVCGPYTYQCLPQPFTLRDDDLAAIASLYPEVIFYDPSAPPPAPGKTWSYAQASFVYGTLAFPTGEGMQGVNLVLQRQEGGWNIPEAWEDVSTVSGAGFQQNAGNPVTGPATGMAGSMGSTNLAAEGYYQFTWVPDIDPAGDAHGPMFAVLSIEPINPLYAGTHAVGPYTMGQVALSGAAVSQLQNQNPLQPYMYPWYSVEANLPSNNAASSCNTGGDGVENAPQPVAAGGWWTGVLCAHGHAAWSSFALKAGRTATLEATALDESGLATTAKAMPLIGAWAASDATGTLPTVAATASAFNTTSLGMTAAGVETTNAEGLRLVIADARGDGRPDFAYQARVLYADTVEPAIASVNGGQITIAGMGFRAGNEVTVNGVAAAVSSWTATTIVAVAPMESAFRTQPSGAVDVAVVDLATGGSTVMTGALSYGGVAPDEMTLVSAPPGTVAVGTAVSFAVRMLLGDGVTPVVGLPVTFSVGMGSVQFGGCTAPPCVVMTDATGMAAATVTATAFGTVTVTAAALGAAQTATFNAVARNVTAVQTTEYVAAGATVAWTPQVSLVENGAPAAGTTVEWMGSSGLTFSPESTAVNAAGTAETSAVGGPLAAGIEATGQVCAWTTVCVSITAVAVDPSAWRLAVVSGAGQAVPLSGSFAPVVVRVTDGSGDAVAGAPVGVYQTVDAAEMPCPAHGPCPVAPVLAASNSTATSDANGLISVTPMQVTGVGEVTSIAVATGTQGFVSLAIDQGP